LGTILFNLDLPNATRYARSKKRDPDGRVMEVELPPFEERKLPVFDLMGEISRSVADPRQEVAEVVVTDPMGELYRRLLEEVSNRSIHPTFDHRLWVTTQIERYCRFLCELPTISAIFVCHELPVKDESTESFERLPFTGTTNINLGAKLMSMVDVIAYAGVSVQENGAKEYGAQLIIDQGRRGGDRFDCLGDYRPLDLKDWFAAIAGAEVADLSAETSSEEPAGKPVAEAA
jgi:hypothetical protein